jgi:hypothetical protein
MNQYTVIDEPDEEERAAIECRKAEVRAQIAARKPYERGASKGFLRKPEPMPPASAAEASRRAISEFRRATRGTPMIDRAKNPEASQYRGVYATGSTKNPWTAKIGIDGKQKTIGQFLTAEEAARAYDAARVEVGREPVNFPDDPTPPASTAAAAANGHDLAPRTRVPEGSVRAVAPPPPQALPPTPSASLGRELAAAAAIAEALAPLDAAEARRVLEFVGGHYCG